MKGLYKQTLQAHISSPHTTTLDLNVMTFSMFSYTAKLTQWNMEGLFTALMYLVTIWLSWLEGGSRFSGNSETGGCSSTLLGIVMAETLLHLKIWCQLKYRAFKLG